MVRVRSRRSGTHTPCPLRPTRNCTEHRRPGGPVRTSMVLDEAPRKPSRTENVTTRSAAGRLMDSTRPTNTALACQYPAHGATTRTQSQPCADASAGTNATSRNKRAVTTHLDPFPLGSSRRRRRPGIFGPGVLRITTPKFLPDLRIGALPEAAQIARRLDRPAVRRQ